MTSPSDKVSVAYIKLNNGHNFQAGDQQGKWLYAMSPDIDNALEQVSEQLSAIMGGGVWKPTQKTLNFLKEEAITMSSHDSPSGFRGSWEWQLEAA